MKKEDILVIGAGGCGNRQLNELMKLDARYGGLFLNSNLSEMDELEYFDKDRRCFYISNADGCGKDMEKMKQFAKEEAPKFYVMIKKFTQPYFLFLASANGGTGSMATLMYAKLIKSKCSEKSINLAITFPALTETSTDFENAIQFWNEVSALKKNNIIDSIQYIDNNKGSEKEVNIKAMKQLDESFNMVNGKLDTSDSLKVHSTVGYKVFLKLDENIENREEAIDTAIKNSMFYMPSNFECDKMIGDINTNDFSIKFIKEEFECYDFSKFNENTDNETKILLGGCEMPKETIDLVCEALKELKNKKRKRVVEEDIIIKRNKPTNASKKDEVPTKSRITSSDLNELFADDSFWDN
ncbi:hypothetical protein [Clostridium tagluense]|uniref:Cell division protein FtsZ n=1 Tax=Clostridium tagluense TaxID=360422 RepID=A0A401USV3_9CLOT|nr:hypothetical protein [Clostridium tagluense]GCD12586.1 cell division protein FtsZ [Clostridium tagluense]